MAGFPGIVGSRSSTSIGAKRAGRGTLIDGAKGFQQLCTLPNGCEAPPPPPPLVVTGWGGVYSSPPPAEATLQQQQRLFFLLRC